MYPISIILPVYNGIKYLRQSVESILNQEFGDFEFLVIDDCSTDGSWEYLNGLQDKRITLYRNELNRGLFYNLNFLIKKSHSTIIKIWAQDDMMYPHCLKEIIAFHQQHPEISFSYTERDFINADGVMLESRGEDNTPEIISPDLHAKISFMAGSIAGNICNVSINKSILDEVGLFNESMRISGDFEMWVRLAKKHPVGFIKKHLVQFRNHKEQLSGQEEYLIYHLKEDLQVYRILLGYISTEQQTSGRKLLRNNKFLFYYTLMLKAFFKGQFTTAYDFLKLLSGFDNFYIITWCYFKNKLFK